MNINLREYQRQVMSGLFLNSGHDRLAHIALGLAGEAGEVADIVKKSQYKGRSLDAQHLVEELGDVLWYLTAAAGEFNHSIEMLAMENIVKLEDRHGPEFYSTRLLSLVPA